jgi:hypothetical protein
MKFLNPHSFSGWVSSLAKTTAIFAGLASITGCASTNGFFHNADSPLLIKTLDAIGGEIVSTRAFETTNRLYVAGSMRRSIGLRAPLGAHVDIQLLDKNGHILAEKQDEIDSPAHPRAAGGRSHRHRSSYVASFPLDLARQAASIRVSYHPEQHAASRSTGASQR